MKRTLFTVFVTLFLVLPAFCAYNSWGVPDSAEIRKGLVEEWFEAPLPNARTNTPKLFSNQTGEKFQVSLEETDTEFHIIVSSSQVLKIKNITATEEKIVEQDVYTGTSRGSWFLCKDKKDNKPKYIRYYFSEDSDVYIQFVPYGKTALADLVIFGNYAAHGVATGVPFSKFYTASFDEVLKITAKSIPWKYVDVKDKNYDNIFSMAAIINKNLPDILLTEDAMYDEDNNLIKISDGKPYDSFEQEKRLYLSSAGFVKWIADGIVYPNDGSLIKRAPLITETVKVKNTGRQGVISQKYSLFFSLDWIRNLSSAVISSYTGKKYLFYNSGVDVTTNYFSNSLFVTDNGYSVKVLKSVLYVLAATEPGTLYFAAIRETDRSKSPEIKTFNECAVFMPYFDTNGKFGCYVYKDGKKRSLDDFYVTYPEESVYLTRVRATETFYPYEIK